MFGRNADGAMPMASATSTGLSRCLSVLLNVPILVININEKFTKKYFTSPNVWLYRNLSMPMNPSTNPSLRIGRAFLLALALGFAATSSVFASSGTRYYLNDHLATTVVIADAAGEIAAMEADAFGSPLAGGGNPGRFTGKPYDEDLGAYVFPFRNYRAEEGRWLTPDPSGFPDGVNGLHYASSPLTGIDRLGLTFSYFTDLIEPESDVFYVQQGKSTADVGFIFSGSIIYSSSPVAQVGIFSFLFIVGVINSGQVLRIEVNLITGQDTTSHSLSFSGGASKAFKPGTYTVEARIYSANNGNPAGGSLSSASYAFEVRE